MPMDEIIRMIEQTDTENIQDVLHAVIKRYRELYPQWRILFMSADRNAGDEQSREVLKWIQYLEEKYAQKSYGNMNEK